jgi:hypothetical protein
VVVPQRGLVVQNCNLLVSPEIVASRDDFNKRHGARRLLNASTDAVAQVSKPAVSTLRSSSGGSGSLLASRATEDGSPTSKSAVRQSLDGLRIAKSATQQTWKSALLGCGCIALLYRRIAFCGTSASATALKLLDAQPITNRRYGRLQICATPCASRPAPAGLKIHSLYSGPGCRG